MKELIIAELGKLVELKLQDAGRATNLFWLGFGDMIPIIRRGKNPSISRIRTSYSMFLENYLK